MTVLLLCSPVLVADQSEGEVPALLSNETIRQDNYLPDFSFAGYGNGLAAIPDASGTVVRVDDFGASANDESDDTKAVLAAISHAHEVAGPVIVRFSAGRYIVSEGTANRTHGFCPAGRRLRLRAAPYFTFPAP